MLEDLPELPSTSWEGIYALKNPLLLVLEN
jgi:hypothetical protein